MLHSTIQSKCSLGSFIVTNNIIRRIPSVKVKENIRTGQVELEVSDDPEDCIELDIDEIPISVTLTKVRMPSNIY